MFRRDFVSSLLSFLPASWALQRASSPKSFSSFDGLGPVTRCNVTSVTHYFNSDLSLDCIKMEGWFKVVGGPSVLNAMVLKVRSASLSGQTCDSPIPRPVSGTRRLSLAITVSPDSKTVYWYTVDHEDLSRLQASTPN